MRQRQRTHQQALQLVRGRVQVRLQQWVWAVLGWESEQENVQTVSGRRGLMDTLSFTLCNKCVVSRAIHLSLYFISPFAGSFASLRLRRLVDDLVLLSVVDGPDRLSPITAMQQDVDRFFPSQACHCFPSLSVSLFRSLTRTSCVVVLAGGVCGCG